MDKLIILEAICIIYGVLMLLAVITSGINCKRKYIRSTILPKLTTIFRVCAMIVLVFGLFVIFI